MLIESAFTDVGSLASVSGDLRPTSDAPNHLMSPRCRGGEAARVTLRTFTDSIKNERHIQYVTRAVEAAINLLTHFMGYFHVSYGRRSRVLSLPTLPSGTFVQKPFLVTHRATRECFSSRSARNRFITDTRGLHTYRVPGEGVTKLLAYSVLLTWLQRL